eukprot:398351_1
MAHSEQNVNKLTFHFTIEAEEDLEEYFDDEEDDDDYERWDMSNKTIEIDKYKINYKFLIQQIMQTYIWLEWEEYELSWHIYNGDNMITNNSELMTVIHKHNDNHINMKITAEYQTQLVIENSSYMMKAGFGGDDAPRAVFPSIVKRPQHQGVMVGMKDAYVGDDLSYGYNSCFPIERRIIVSWDDMEKIWHHTFYNELRIQPEEHSVLMTDRWDISYNKSHREKITQIMFETFNVLQFYIIYYPLCSLYACDSRTTGVVLDSGYNMTECTPIYNGHIISNAITISNFGGYDITQHLCNIINEKPDWSFTTKWEKEIIRDMKEKLCFVSNKLDMKNDKETSKNYEFPDGHVYRMEVCERTEPAECLFKPFIMGKNENGIHDLIYKSVMKCDLNIQYELFNNIILSGGNTLFVGI